MDFRLAHGLLIRNMGLIVHMKITIKYGVNLGLIVESE